MTKPIIPPSKHGPSHTVKHPTEKEKQAVEESKHPTVSRPGGYQNDPDDPTNPNEAIERHRRKFRRGTCGT
jgi:hypothetical protein